MYDVWAQKNKTCANNQKTVYKTSKIKYDFDILLNCKQNYSTPSFARTSFAQPLFSKQNDLPDC